MWEFLHSYLLRWFLLCPPGNASPPPKWWKTVRNPTLLDLQSGSPRAFLPHKPLCFLPVPFLFPPTLILLGQILFSALHLLPPCSDADALLKCQLQVMKTPSVSWRRGQWWWLSSMSLCHYNNCSGGRAKTSNKLPSPFKCLSAVFATWIVQVWK